MYCSFDEMVFIVCCVIIANLIWKFSGAILKGIGRLTIKLGAKVMAAELKEIEIRKAIDKAKKEVE